MAIVFLVTGKRQRVERQWIVFRRRNLLLHQRAKDARFDIS